MGSERTLPSRSKLAAVCVVAALAATVATVVVARSGDDAPPGWSEVRSLDASLEWFVRPHGVGGGATSVSLGREFEADGRTHTFGVHVFNNATLGSEFIALGDPTDRYNTCDDSVRITVGRAGFVADSAEPGCRIEETRTVSVSPDGADWTNVAVPPDATIVAGAERFLLVSGDRFDDALTGEPIADPPWRSDFFVDHGAALDDGTQLFIGREPGGPFGRSHAYRSDGDEWVELDLADLLDDVDLLGPVELLQSMGDSFLVVPGGSTLGIVARSTDGESWSDNSPIPPLSDVLSSATIDYASPGRVLLHASVNEGSACFAMSEECDVPQRLYFEYTPDGIQEVLTAYAMTDRANGVRPFVSVDADGRYAAVVPTDGDDERVELVSMTDRDVGDPARFDLPGGRVISCAAEISTTERPVYAQLRNDGATITFKGNVLERVTAGPGSATELRSAPWDDDLAMFTAKRVPTDRIEFTVFPTGELFGTYDASEHPLDLASC